VELRIHLIHETATILGPRPTIPCYPNLLLFDPFKPRESPETIIPELGLELLVDNAYDVRYDERN